MSDEEVQEAESVDVFDDDVETPADHAPNKDISGYGKIWSSIMGTVGTLMSMPLVNRPAYRFWKATTLLSLQNFHKAHGGDRTALEQFPNGEIDLTPAKWKPMELCDDNEQPGWKVKNRDKTYKPTSFGQTGPRLGKVPVLPLDNESWKSTSYAEATVAEAIDQGEHRPLYDVSEAELTATLDARGDAGQMTGGSAVADGGQDMTITDMRFNPRTNPIFKDYIIPLGGDEWGGRAVSFWKAKELMSESSTTEEMAAQEERGFLAGRSRKDMKKWMVKILLIAGAIAAVGIVGDQLVAALLGGGGGGGGGIVPI